MGTDRNNFYRNHHEFRGTKRWGVGVRQAYLSLFIIFMSRQGVIKD